MTVGAIAHGVLLALATLALIAGALRVAALVAPRGLERWVAAATIACAAATIEALVVGWIGLGMSAVALAVAALASWALAVRLTARPSVPVRRQLVGRWRTLGTAGRRLAGAGAGVVGAFAAYGVARPALGYDTWLYHLPLSIAWVQEGNPGAVNQITTKLEVGAYPALDELIQAWAAALAESFVPFALWPIALGLLIVAGTWLALRSLRVPAAVAVPAVVAVVVTPAVIGFQATGASTDPAALAWLVVCAGLCAASLRPACGQAGTNADAQRGATRRPGLLAVALVAAGLAVGTKPTVAPLAAIVVVVAFIAHRGGLRGNGRALTLGAAAAAVAGGWWYVRNLVLYGSPLWPFYATPWGTPPPETLRDSPTLLADLEATVRAIGDLYLNEFGGSLLLLAGGILAPLLSRRRSVVIVAAATLLAVLLYTVTPYTGLASALPLATFATTRYLVGGVAAGALALALAARGTGVGSRIALALLVLAAIVNVVQTLDVVEPPALPPPWIPLVGALLGALGAVGLGALGRRPGMPAALGRLRHGRSPHVVAATAVSVAAGLAGIAVGLAGPHQLDRLAAAEFATPADGALLSWALAQPGFRDGDWPVTALPLRPSTLAGPRLNHPVELEESRSCARLRAAARRGWVVVWNGDVLSLHDFRPLACFAGRPPVYASERYAVFTERGS